MGSTSAANSKQDQPERDTPLNRPSKGLREATCASSTRVQTSSSARISVSSPDIAENIRPLPSRNNVASLSIKKRTEMGRQQGDRIFHDTSNVLQVRPIMMKPKNAGPLAQD